MPLMTPAWPSVDHGLAEMLEGAEAAHLQQQVTSLARFPELGSAPIRTLSGGVAAITRPDFGRKLNHVCGAALREPLDVGALSGLETDYAALGLATEIDLCPYTQPEAFAVLAERGYRVTAFSNTYWLELVGKVDAEPPTSSVHVRPPQPRELDLFVDASTAGFSAQPQPRSRELLGTLARSACSRLDTELFVAEVAGAIAGTAALSLLPTTAGVVAHLFLASTLPWARNRGIQTALLAARTRVALQRGARFAHITARPGTTSARNVERAGYRLAYTKLTLSKAPPSRD